MLGVMVTNIDYLTYLYGNENNELEYEYYNPVAAIGNHCWVGLESNGRCN